MNGRAPIGRRRWAVSAGCAPSRATGPEPEMGSFDLLCLLNAGDAVANVRMRVLYAGHGEPEIYRLVVAPRRVRQLRINDLIFPEAVLLDVPYSLVIESDVPIVVQFTRQDTRAAANAGMMTMAWSQD